jgi:hypothetical protein
MKLLKHYSFSLALLCLALAERSLAVGGVNATPSPGPAHEISFTHPKETKLANGLRVIVAERPSLPLLAMELIIRVGSEKDPNDRAGNCQCNRIVRRHDILIRSFRLLERWRVGDVEQG